MAFWYAIFSNGPHLPRLTNSARFNILSSIIVGVTALICLLAPSVNASTAGFALAFANSIQHDLLFVVRRFVQLEQSMVALERIKEWVLPSCTLIIHRYRRADMV